VGGPAQLLGRWTSRAALSLPLFVIRRHAETLARRETEGERVEAVDGED